MCSVSSVIRWGRSAICTRVEPESLASRPYFPTISVFCSWVSGIAYHLLAVALRVTGIPERRRQATPIRDAVRLEGSTGAIGPIAAGEAFGADQGSVAIA